MPLPLVLEKAQLREIYLDVDGNINLGSPSGGTGKVVDVQFNPESMVVSHTKSSADNGRPTSTLTLALWFDVTTLGPFSFIFDVQKLTKEIDYFIMPLKPGPWTHGVRFLWSSFSFDGWINQLNETFDYFAADGTPLRANLSITISNQGMYPKKG
jgi:hypothetical protein